jgi:protein-S-isoprenylcysteine O-methyltransferase Ste14
MDTTQDSKVRRGARRWLVRETLGNLVLIAILFGVLGRWDWWNGWALSAMYILWSAATAILVLPVNPAMLAERARPGAGSKRWDMALLGVLALLMIAEYVVASLDVRNGWSPDLPAALQLASLVIAFLGLDVLFVWSMISNAFFVGTVRIQTDRGHTVVSSRPYRFLRHPGYAGTLLLHLATPFMLNSLWALIPAGLTILIMVIRTYLEDKTLQAELPGYREYASRVLYRLVPGLW